MSNPHLWVFCHYNRLFCQGNNVPFPLPSEFPGQCCSSESFCRCRVLSAAPPHFPWERNLVPHSASWECSSLGSWQHEPRLSFNCRFHYGPTEDDLSDREQNDYTIYLDTFPTPNFSLLFDIKSLKPPLKCFESDPISARSPAFHAVFLPEDVKVLKEIKCNGYDARANKWQLSQ